MTFLQGYALYTLGFLGIAFWLARRIQLVLDELRAQSSNVGEEVGNR